MAKKAVTDLESLQKELYKVFNEAVKEHENYSDPSSASEYTPGNYAVQNRIAMGTLAQAIAAIEAIKPSKLDK